jgi:DNA-binding XRE family transcriptional regulator
MMLGSGSEPSGRDGLSSPGNREIDGQGATEMKRVVQTGPKEPQAVDRHVADRIRQKRIEIGMTQETLADALGVTFQQVQKYEKGTNRVSAGRLFRIANLLEVEVSYFFEGLPRVASKSRKRA